MCDALLAQAFSLNEITCTLKTGRKISISHMTIAVYPIHFSFSPSLSRSRSLFTNIVPNILHYFRFRFIRKVSISLSSPPSLSFVHALSIYLSILSIYLSVDTLHNFNSKVYKQSLHLPLVMTVTSSLLH